MSDLDVKRLLNEGGNRLATGFSIYPFSLTSGPNSQSSLIQDSTTVSGSATAGADSGEVLGAKQLTPGISNAIIERMKRKSTTTYKGSQYFMQFPEFLDAVEKNPKKYLRPVVPYVMDAIEYWNKVAGVKPGETVRYMGKEYPRLAFIEKPWEPKELQDKECVQGQIKFFNELIERLTILSRMKHPNKIILVHGPNATGKSRVFETMFQMLEEYSKTPEGAMYTWNWVFDHGITPMGFGADKQEAELYSRPITPDEVLVRIPAGKNANPIFLLDQEERTNLVRSLNGHLPPDFNTDYIIDNGLNALSTTIYQGLWEEYEGDVSKILRHVHVVRWQYCTQNRTGLTLIQPGVAENDTIESITPDINWGDLPRNISSRLSTMGLNRIRGELTSSNHGVIVHDDEFKDGNVDLQQLRLAEKGNTVIEGNKFRDSAGIAVDERFDLLQFGTTNDDTLYRVQDHPEWESLRGRYLLLPLPFERTYRPVSKIFAPNLRQSVPPNGKRHAAPHTVERLGLWLTMTYLFPPRNPNYYNSLEVKTGSKEQLFALAKNLGIIDKALLYQGEDLNAFVLDPANHKYSQQEQELLRAHIAEIADEYNISIGRTAIPFYEGSIGLNTRTADGIFDRAARLNPDECFSVVELFKVLDEEIRQGFEFEDRRDKIVHVTNERLGILREKGIITPELEFRIPSIPEKFPKTSTLLDQVKEYERRVIMYEVNDALGCIRTDEERLTTLKKYIAHVIALKNNGRVPDQYQDPPQNSKPNTSFITKIESKFVNVESNKEVEEFRLKIRTRSGDWITDPNNKAKDLYAHISEIFPDLLKRLISSDIESNKSTVDEFLADLRFHFEPTKEKQGATLDPEREAKLMAGIANLKKIGYCERCIPKTVLHFAYNR